MQKKTDLIIHPIRLRIIQIAARRKKITVAELSQAMTDVPKATLYRHVKTLVENEILMVTGQEKIRGTLELTYSLQQEKIFSYGNEPLSKSQSLVYAMLAKLLEDFRHYFNEDTGNPVADKLFVACNTLQLSDEAFDSFIGEFYDIVEKFSGSSNEPTEKTRMLTLVSSPVFENPPAKEK